jgi:hypothetical protein
LKTKSRRQEIVKKGMLEGPVTWLSATIQYYITRWKQ